jgi:oligoendopeptidase F
MAVMFEDIFDQETVEALLRASTDLEYVQVLREKINTFINVKIAEQIKNQFYATRDAEYQMIIQDHNTKMAEFATKWNARETYAMGNNDWMLTSYTGE